MAAETTRHFSIKPETDPVAWLDLDPSSNPVQAQDVELWFDPQDGALAIHTRYRTSGTPEHIWHQRTLRWDVPRTADAVALTRDINAGELDALLSRIAAGHSIAWDGSNHVGELTEDAHEARIALGEQLDRYADGLGDGAGLWEAGDWFIDMDWENEGLSAASTDAELGKLATRLEQEAAAERAVVVGVVEHLRQERENLRFEAEG